MDVLKGYLEAIVVAEQKARMEEIFNWIHETFPSLEAVIKWNQAMFVDHGTLIIGFSMAKQHMSFTPEEAVITIFTEDIKKAGYEHTKGIVKVKWADEVNYELIKRLIEFNMIDKAECKTFFRK